VSAHALNSAKPRSESSTTMTDSGRGEEQAKQLTTSFGQARRTTRQPGVELTTAQDMFKGVRTTSGSTDPVGLMAKMKATTATKPDRDDRRRPTPRLAFERYPTTSSRDQHRSEPRAGCGPQIDEDVRSDASKGNALMGSGVSYRRSRLNERRLN